MWGLNAPSKKCMLRKCIEQVKPAAVLIQETKSDQNTMTAIANKCWRNNEVSVAAANGSARGLALLWDPLQIALENRLQTDNYISAHYKILDSQEQGYISNVYGLANPLLKGSFLEALKTLGVSHQGHPWLLRGDFNVIVSF